MDAEHIRPRRSCLYVPGANARAIEKACELPADVVILDLEDAVAPAAKSDARNRVCDAVSSRRFGDREVVVRINAATTPWGADDLAAAIAAGPDAVLVPKVTSADDVYALDAAIAASGCDEGAALWAMIELPLAVLNCRAIAAAGQNTRLNALVLGTNDLAKALHAGLTTGNEAFTTSLQMAVLAARAYGLAVLDGVFNDIDDTDRLTLACTQARNWGFDGKTLIHPSQIAVANQVFSPDAQELARARAVVAAFSAPENHDAGVLAVDGVMTERLHLEQAEQVLAIHARIQRLAETLS